jgi:serine/threonine protein kinase KIN1/2
VATTSTKPPPVIKTDVRRVLDRMQVQYRETKNGFECIHLPSIDLASVETPRQSHYQDVSGTASTSQTLTKKSSKMSFSRRGKERDRERDREPSSDTDGKERNSNSIAAPRPSTGTNLTATASSGSSSFFNVNNHAPPTSATSDQQQQQQQQSNGNLEVENQQQPRSQSPAASSVKSKTLPPIPRDFVVGGSSGNAGMRSPSPMPLPTGEVDKELFESIGSNSLSVRFEINIVKVSAFSISFFGLLNLAN